MAEKIFKILEKKNVGFEEVEENIMKDDAIDSKTKRLIAIGCAASMNCDFCVDHHTNLARQEGITEDEITEALLVSSLVGFGSKVRHLAKMEKEEE